MVVFVSEPVLVHMYGLLSERDEQSLVKLLPLHALFADIAVLAGAGGTSRCVCPCLFVLLLAHLRSPDDFAVVEDGSVDSLDGEWLSLRVVELPLVAALVLLEQVLQHKCDFFVEAPAGLPIEHHVFLEVAYEFGVDGSLLSVKYLMCKECLSHEGVSESVDPVPVAVFEEQLDDVPVLELLELASDMHELVLIQFAHTPQLLHSKDIADNGRTLEDNQGAYCRLARQLLHEVIAHQRLLKNPAVIFAHLIRQREVVPTVRLYTLTQLTLTHQHLLVYIHKVILHTHLLLHLNLLLASGREFRWTDAGFRCISG